MWNGGCTGYEYDNAADIRLVATPEKAENQAALCRKPPPPEQQAFNGARTPLYGDQEVRVTRTLTATMLSEGDVWVEAKIVIGTMARIVKVDVDGDVVLNIWQNHLREEFSSQMKVRADDKQWLWILLVFPRGSFVRAMSDIRTLTKASAKNKEMFVISTGSIGQIVHASFALWDGQASAMVEFMHFGPKKRVVVPMEGLAGFQNLKVFLEGKIVAPVRDIKYQDDQQGSYNIPQGLEGVVKAVDDSGDVLVAWGPPPDAEDAYVKLEDLDLLQLHPEGTAVAIARPEQAGVAVAFTYDLVKKEARLSPGQVVTIRDLVAPSDELNGARCVLLEYRRKRLWRARRLESGFEVFEIHRRHLSIEETGWKEDQTVRIVVPPEEDDQVIIALHGFNGKLLKYHGNDGWGVQMVTGSDKRAFLFQPEYLETEFRRGVHVVIRGLSDEAEIYNDRTCELHRFNHETLCWQAEVEDVGGVLAQRGCPTMMEIPVKNLKLKDVTGNPDSMGVGDDDDMKSNGAYEDSEMTVNQDYESSKGLTTVDEHLLVRSGSVGSQVRPRLSESRRKRFKSVGEDSEEAHLQRQRNQKKAPLPAPKGWRTKFDSENGRFFHYDPDNVENWKFADEAMTDFMTDFATEKIRHEDVPSTKPRSRSRSLKRSRSIQEVDMEDSKEARRKYLEGAEGDEGTTLPGGTTLIRASKRTKMGTELCVADVTEFKANDKVKISQGSQSETCTIRDMTKQLFDDHIWIITVHEQLQYTYEEGATIKKVVQALGSIDMTVNPSYESVQQLRRSGEVLETKVREEAKPGSAIVVESSKGMERGDFIELISGDKKHLSQIEATRPSIDMVIIAPPSTQMFPKGSTVRVMKAGGSKKSTAQRRWRNSVSLLQTKSDLEAAP
jgi:phage pi2 protein 07